MDDKKAAVEFDVISKNSVLQTVKTILEILDFDYDFDLDFCQRLKVDLIITDYCMPGMTGYELLKKIKVLHFPAIKKIC